MVQSGIYKPLSYLSYSFFRSSPFNVEDIGTVHFRLQESGVTRLIRTDVGLNESTIFISFSLADDEWPFRIENDSDYEVAYRQAVGPCHPSS